MKIEKISIWKLALKSHVPYYMSLGKTCDTVDTIVLRLDTDNELSGWGEVCPIPHYLPAYADGVLPALDYVLPVLLGADPLGVKALMSRINQFLLGHAYAKSMIDIALWDITAQAAQLPLYALLGGRYTHALPLYHSISCLEPEKMREIAKQAQEQGIKQFQVKLGADNRWRTDVQRLHVVRETVGEDCLVYGDFNCGVSRLYATRVGRAVSHLDIMIEQPCPTLADCAAVRQATGLAMKIDENAYDIETLLRAHSLGCMDAVAIKLSKFSGISGASEARDLCLYLGAQMCIEDVWGSDIVTMAALHLATATPTMSVLNVCDLSAYVSPHIAPDAPLRSQGHITLLDTPGLGVTPDEQILGTPLKVYTK